MTEWTEQIPPLSGRDRSIRRASAMVSALLAGVVAAGLGLGALAVAVLFLWITSPYPDSGPGGALHVAVALWLLAHGAGLLRTNGITGTDAPVGLTPLLLTVLTGWLVHRAAAHAIAPDEVRTARPARPIGPLATIGWLVAGYLLTATAAVLYTAHGPLRSAPSTALWSVTLLVVPIAALGAWTGCGRPPWTRATGALAEGLRHVPGVGVGLLPRGAAAVTLRAALAAGSTLIGGGAVLFVSTAGWHAAAVQHSLVRLTLPVSGRFAVFLLAVALLPNAAVWSAAYALGPGFVIGVGGSVSPAGLQGYPQRLPDFPLLAALPGRTGGSADGFRLAWLVLVVPVVMSAVLAWCVTRPAAERGWRAGPTAGVAAVAALACGAVTALVAGYAAGPLGTGGLARFGPVAWQTGLAALGWTALLGVPGTLVARWWCVREPRFTVEPPAPSWPGGRARAEPSPAPCAPGARPVAEAGRTDRCEDPGDPRDRDDRADRDDPAAGDTDEGTAPPWQGQPAALDRVGERGADVPPAGRDSVPDQP